MSRAMHDGILAGAIAGLVSGAPSTACAVVAGDDPRAATAAAGSLLLPSETRPARLLLAAVPVHGALSLGWGVLLAAVLPRRHTAAWGAAAGLVIAVLDLGIIGRRFPRIRALPQAPQVADHVLYGAVVGAVLARRRGATKLAGSVRVPARHGHQRASWTPRQLSGDQPFVSAPATSDTGVDGPW